MNVLTMQAIYLETNYDPQFLQSIVFNSGSK